MSNIIKNYGGDRASYKNAYWAFKYTETKTENPGETLVEWEVYNGLDSGNALNMSTYCYIKIEYNNKVLEETEFQQKTLKTFKKETIPRLNGSFTVKHSNDGKGSFKLTFDVFIYDGNNNILTETIDLEHNSPVSSCYWSQDSYITSNLPYIAPGSSFTVSWGGDTAGVGNSIIEKQIYINENLAAVQGGEDHQCEVILPSDDENALARGEEVRIKIVLFNEIGSFEEQAFEQLVGYVNNLPEPPIIVSYTGMNTYDVISKDLDKAEIDVIPGKDQDNQNTEVWFIDATNVNDEEGGEARDMVWQKWQNQGMSFEEKDIKTYWFKTYDGVEYSDEISLSLFRNSDSMVRIIKNETEAGPGFGFTIEETSSQYSSQSGKGVSRQLYVCLGSASEFKEVPFIEQGDIRALEAQLEEFGIKPRKAEETVQLKVEIFDGLDFYYHIVEFQYSVPFYKIYGDQEKQQVEYFNEKIWAYHEAGDEWLTNGLAYDPKIEPGGSLKYIKVQGKNGQEFRLESVNQLTRITQLKLAFKADYALKPYIGSLSLSATNTIESWAKYGLNSMPRLTFWLGDSDTKISTEADSPSGSDLLIYTITGEDAYNIASDFKDLEPKFFEKALNYSYTTVFNDTIELTEVASIQIDFRQTAFGYKGNISPLAEGAKVKENNTFNANFSLYSFVEPRAWLEYNINDVWYTMSGSYVKLQNKGQVIGSGYNIEPTEYNFSDQIGEMSEITKTSSGKIRLVVQTDESSQYTKDFSNITFCRFTEPLIHLVSVVSEDGTIKAKYKIDDYGVDSSEQMATSFFVRFINKENNGIMSDWLEITSVEGELSFIYEIDSDFVSLAPELKSVFELHEQSSEKSTSAVNRVYTLCYNILPTISYRKNRVGINTNKVDEKEYENSVAVISQYSNKSDLTFIGVNDNDKEQTAILNLSNMSLGGFVINAGSWDGTDPGYIPIPSTGLADVATSGQLSDLEHTRSIVVIFRAGDSTSV